MTTTALIAQTVAQRASHLDVADAIALGIRIALDYAPDQQLSADLRLDIIARVDEAVVTFTRRVLGAQ